MKFVFLSLSLCNILFYDLINNSLLSICTFSCFQGNSDAIVLRAIVKAACHWIKAGLPLRCLKIVIYTDKPQTISGPQKNLLGLFAKQKMKWENSKYEEVWLLLFTLPELRRFKLVALF